MKVTLFALNEGLWSIGNRVLSAQLRKAGHETRLVFLGDHSFSEPLLPEVIDRWCELAQWGDVSGLSVMSNNWLHATQLTKALHQKTDKPVIWGGIHPTVRPEESLKHADWIARGEVDNTMIEWLSCLEKGEDATRIPGFYRLNDQGEMEGTPLRVPEKLNEIEPQDYSFEDHWVTLRDEEEIFKVVPLTPELYSFINDGIYLTQASRGCPNSCTYCCNDALKRMNKDYVAIRRRSLDLVIEELKNVKRKITDLKWIILDDDAFFSYPLAELELFSKRYREEVGIQLCIGGAAPLWITEEKVKALVEGGMRQLRMGIQTYADSTRKLFKRPHKNEKVFESLRIINKYRKKMYPPQYDFILDTPWEKEEETIQTLMIASQMPVPHKLSLFSLTFFPATTLYERAKDEKIICNDVKDVYVKPCHGLSNKRVNNLFFLLKDYAYAGFRLPRMIFSYLLNPKIQKMRLDLPVLFLLRMGQKIMVIVGAVRKEYRAVCFSGEGPFEYSRRLRRRLIRRRISKASRKLQRRRVLSEQAIQG